MPTKLLSVPVRSRERVEFVDVTWDVERAVQGTGLREGVVLVRSRHTTAAVICNELESSIHQDAVALIQDLIPLTRRYRHMEEGPENARAHLAVMGLGESTWVPLREGRLDLGTWQRLFLVELFGPRERRLDVAVIGE